MPQFSRSPIEISESTVDELIKSKETTQNHCQGNHREGKSLNESVRSTRNQNTERFLGPFSLQFTLNGGLRERLLDSIPCVQGGKRTFCRRSWFLFLAVSLTLARAEDRMWRKRILLVSIKVQRHTRGTDRGCPRFARGLDGTSRKQRHVRQSNRLKPIPWHEVNAPVKVGLRLEEGNFSIRSAPGAQAKRRLPGVFLRWFLYPFPELFLAVPPA